MQIEELIENSNNGITIQEIEDFEKDLNIKLPNDIKNLYLKYDGFSFNKKFKLYFREYEYDGFYSVYIETITNLKMIKDIVNDHISEDEYDLYVDVYFIEKKILPVIITSEYNYDIGVSVDESSKDYGAFFLLPYEIESNFCKIADNLQDFINKFKKVDN